MVSSWFRFYCGQSESNLCKSFIIYYFYQYSPSLICNTNPHPQATPMSTLKSHTNPFPTHKLHSIIKNCSHSKLPLLIGTLSLTQDQNSTYGRTLRCCQNKRSWTIDAHKIHLLAEDLPLPRSKLRMLGPSGRLTLLSKFD